jgi:tetratricopeptide (TPR) repeat protein
MQADGAGAVNLLSRASALLSGGDRDRAEILCELGVAQWTCGDSAAARETFGEALAVSDKAGNGLSLRAELERSYIELFMDPSADPAGLVEAAQRAIPTFEQAGDDRALGRAWRMIGYVRGSMEGRLADWLEASERARAYYRRSGWSSAGCLAELASALFSGPTPVPAGIDRCEQLLRETTDRLGKANVLVFLGGLHALGGRFEDGFALIDDANEIYRDLGELYAHADNSVRLVGRIHRLAGDPENAERAFRECCETFERIRDKAALSTVACELGQALYAQGRYAEAAEWGRLGELEAPTGDVVAQFCWRGLRGRLLAREGRIGEGEALVSEAVSIVERTDALTHRAEVLLDHAEVLCLGDRQAEAARRIEQALELFERKGNELSAHGARSLLGEKAPA